MSYKANIKKGTPNSREGKNGDITLRKTNSGNELFAKIDGLWYGTKLSRIPGSVKTTLHGKALMEKSVESSKEVPIKKKNISIFKDIKTTKGRRTRVNQISNKVTKTLGTEDMILESGKEGSKSPVLELKNTNAGGGANASFLIFRKQPPAALTVVGDGDTLGTIAWYSNDSDTTNGSVLYASMVAYADDVTDATKNSSIDFFTLDNSSSSMDKVSIDSGNLIVHDGIIYNGWHGHQTRIKILPRDFISNNRYNAIFLDSDGLAAGNALSELYALVPIPTGYKATHARVYSSDTGLTVTVYEADINAAFDNSSNLGTGTPNAEINISDLTSDDTNYLVIFVETAATDDIVYGGYVTIERA